MTEKELVEKLKAPLKKHLKEFKKEMEKYGDEFERYDETMTQLDKATQFKQLTNLVRDLSWDAESWIDFVFSNAFETKIEIGDLAGFDT